MARQIGKGWALSVNDGSAGAYVAIDQVTSMGVPDDGPYGMVESKTLDLTNSTVKRIPTVKTPANFTFTYEFDKTQYARLDALKGTEKNWKVTSTDGTPWTRTVPGVLTVQTPPEVVADGIVLVTATVEVSGVAS